MKTLLIDGDILVYQTCTGAFLIEGKNNYGEYYYKFHSDPAIAELDIRISELVSDTKCRQYIIALGGVGNFRKKILPEYKSNRPHRKPLGYHCICEHLVSRHRAMRVEGLEADDILGILQNNAKFGISSSIIASIDKDMFTIPGMHYNLSSRETKYISEENAMINLVSQSICGDSSDNYKGCPSIGKVKAIPIAEEIVSRNGTSLNKCFNDIANIFISNGATWLDAKISCQMAKILRKEDAKIVNKKIIDFIIWEPEIASCTGLRRKRVPMVKNL